MTLQLRRKRPTIPPSIPESIPAKGKNAPLRASSRPGPRKWLPAAALAITAIGAGSLWSAEPGVEMLQDLKSRDAAALWDSTAADQSNARGQPAASPVTTGDGWRAASAPPTSEPSDGDATGSVQDQRPSAPQVYDPPPIAPPPEAPADPAPPAEEQQYSEPDFPPIPSTPEELRDIETIVPYSDYDPSPNPNAPFEFICPRPEGVPCEDCEEGEKGEEEEFQPPCPEEVPLDTGPFVGRRLPPSVFAWKASNVTNNPLYFQDVALQRYGHTYGPLIQPAVSIGRFGAQLVALPYQMTLNPPHKEMYPLGYYRPGEAAPKLLYQPPLNAKAAAVTAGFYTGFGLLFP